MSDPMVPQLRFAEFDGEWDDSSLANLGRFSKGQGYSKADLKDDGSPLFLYGRVYTNPEVAVVNVYTYANPRPGSVISTGNEVLVPSSGETAEDIATAVALLQPGVLIGGDLNVITPHRGVEPVFLALRIGSGAVKKSLAQRAQGKSVVHIRNSDLQSLQFGIPSADEQQAIGAFFTKVDSLLAQRRSKHKKLQQTKTALMQQMFPRGGSDEPALRFEGFSAPWGRERLGDVATFFNGRAYSQPELLSSGRYPVLRVGNFYTNSAWYFSDLELHEKFYANSGDLLYTWSASFGPHIWTGGKVIYHYHIWKIATTNVLDKTFALHLLQKDREEIIADQNGSTMAHITKAGMEEKEVVVPADLAEQQAIGSLFTRLDELIAAEQKYIDKLEQAKSSLQQKMFV